MTSIRDFLIEPSSAIDESVIASLAQFLRGKSVLVAGASGVVGLALLNGLSSAAAMVRGDIQITGHSLREVPENLRIQYVSYLRGDLASSELNLGAQGFDFSFFAAGYGQPAKFQADARGAIAVNTLGLMNVIDSTRESLLYVSTSEVYSGLSGSVTEEEAGITSTTHGRAAYIEAKKVGEVLTLGESVRLQTIVARLGLGYGPGFRSGDSRVLYEMVRRGIDGKVFIRDSGAALRSYIHANDVADVFFRLLLGGNSGIFNVSGPESRSIRDLGMLIADKLEVEFEADIDAQTFKADSPKEVSLDLNKTKAYSGKENYMPVELGLDSVISWAKETRLKS